MLKSKTTLIIFFIFIASAFHTTFAESLNEKVARNAANCLTGHIATNSPMYQSGEAGKYLLLIKKILGSEKAMSEVKKSANNLKASVKLMGSNSQTEGKWLIQNFCPGVNAILNKK